MSFNLLIQEKITSAEAWERIAKPYWREVGEVKRWMVGHMPAWTTKDLWWVQREAARCYTEYYVVTEELQRLNTRFGLFAHISQKDPTLVAYTPDAASGERDAQQVVSPGRLLTRYYSVSTQDYVRTEVENHNATANAVVEFIEGPAIAETYNSMIGTGLSSCMTKDSFKDGENPTLAYDAPGIKLAVMRSSDGKINARTLVYESGDSKVYIRGYGNPSLIKKLKNLGYRVGNFAGAKFKAIESNEQTGLDDDYKLFVFPYLDANGAMAARVGSTIVWMDDHIYAPKENQLALLASYAGMGGSGGAVRLRKVPEYIYRSTCAISGEVVNRLSDTRAMVKFWDVNLEAPEKGVALQQAVDDYVESVEDIGVVEAHHEGRCILAKVEHIVTINWKAYINTPSNLITYGLVELDKAIYPEGGYWHRNELVLINGLYYKEEETVRIYSKDGYFHALKKHIEDKAERKKYIMLHGSILATKDCGYVVTETGRKVHPKVHELGYDAVTGKVNFRRGHQRRPILGTTYLAPMGTSTIGLKQRLLHSPFFAEQVFKDLVAEGEEIGERLTWDNIRLLTRNYCDMRLDSIGNYMPEDMRQTLGFTYWGDYLQPPVEYVAKLAEMLTRSGEPLAHAVGRRISRELAEAEALEYPNQLIEIPAEVAPPPAPVSAVATLPNPEIEVI